MENAFGIAISKFRVFRRVIIANLDTAVEVTKAVVVLHNFLVKDKSQQNPYCPPNFPDQERDGEIYPGT